MRSFEISHVRSDQEVLALPIEDGLYGRHYVRTETSKNGYLLFLAG